MPKITVYTCVTGSYDRLAEDTGGQADEYLCFSNALQPVHPWQQRILAHPANLNEGREINRYHKLFPHRLLPETDYSIYQDGNIRFPGSYADLVARLRASDAALGVFAHPSGRNLQEEVDACRRRGKLSPQDLERVTEQLAFYAAQGVDLAAPISANYLLVRDHKHPGIAGAMDLWWSQLERFTGRDQLSLSYVLESSGLPYVVLDAPEVTARLGTVPQPERHPHLKGRWAERLARFRWALRH